MHTKESLTPVLLNLFSRLKTELPTEIAERLTCSRKVKNHGSCRTLFLFNVWDIHQTDVLHRDYFNYCLGYDPLKIYSGGSTWYLHLWINTIRLYRSQQEIKSRLEKDLKTNCPKPFKFYANAQSLQLKINFEFNGPLADFPDYMAPRYLKLITPIQPLLIPIIDAFRQPLTKEERRKAILGRKKIYVGPASRPARSVIAEYTRSISATLRAKILQKHGRFCAHCKSDLAGKEIHIDHIVPFSKGGSTVFENLQPLCAPCNLAKGNRLLH